MSTSHVGGPAPGALDRLTDWVLDHDGDIYGQDERERLRWYEGIALSASAQWFLVPWALAVLIWFADRDAAILLAVVAAVFYLGMIPATVHVMRKRVETHRMRWSAKRVIGTALAIPPGPLFVLGFMRVVGDAGTVEFTAAAAGGVIGAGIGFALLSMRSRARARRLAAEADPEMD